MGNWSDAENTAAQEAARQLQERYRTIQQVEQQAPPQAPLPQAPRPQETLGELVARDAGLDRETIQRESRERLLGQTEGKLTPILGTGQTRKGPHLRKRPDSSRKDTEPSGRLITALLAAA